MSRNRGPHREKNRTNLESVRSVKNTLSHVNPVLPGFSLLLIALYKCPSVAPLWNWAVPDPSLDLGSLRSYLSSLSK